MGPACTPLVVGSVRHLQICWICCPSERMIRSKGYWGTSVFFPLGMTFTVGFMGFQMSVVQIRMLKWWDLLGSFRH